jgi:hypothetical protein
MANAIEILRCSAGDIADEICGGRSAHLRDRLFEWRDLRVSAVGRAKTFAAFASVAGEIFPPAFIWPTTPLLQIADEQDDVVPFAKRRQSVQIARELNGSTSKGQGCGPYCTMYPSSKGAPVETYIHPGGYVWPQEAAVIGKFLKSCERAQ